MDTYATHPRSITAAMASDHFIKAACHEGKGPSPSIRLKSLASNRAYFIRCILPKVKRNSTDAELASRFNTRRRKMNDKPKPQDDAEEFGGGTGDPPPPPKPTPPPPPKD